MRRIILLVVLIVLGGCADQLAQRQAFLNRFIGQSETTLVQGMGVPNRSYETGGAKFLAYDEQRIETLPSPFAMGPWGFGWYRGGFPPDVVTLVCETTFAVKGGVVVSYALRGNACG